MPDPLVLKTDRERDDWLADEVGCGGGVCSNPVVEPDRLAVLPHLSGDPLHRRIMAKFERELAAARPREQYLKKKILAGRSSPAERKEKLLLDKKHTAILGRREMALKKAFPGEITEAYVLPYAGTKMSLLTQTTKMACYSFSHSAIWTCPGAEESIKLRTPERLGLCFQCYATKGNYDRYRIVKALSYERMFFTQNHDDFVDTMVEAIKHPRRYGGSPKKWTDPRFFRIHDSGDCYSVEYAQAWERIISSLPEVLFWMPTRVWAASSRPGLLSAVRRIAALPTNNVCVRPSALAFNDLPPNGGGTKVAGLHAGAGSVFIKEPRAWNLGAAGSMARKLHGDKGSFGIVKPDWSPETRKIMEEQHGVFFCPAADYEQPEFNCTTMPGPDGKKPCRVCWGVTSKLRQMGTYWGRMVDYRTIPVAHKWH